LTSKSILTSVIKIGRIGALRDLMINMREEKKLPQHPWNTNPRPQMARKHWKHANLQKKKAII
jgi:hypothetical protein